MKNIIIILSLTLIGLSGCYLAPYRDHDESGRNNEHHQGERNHDDNREDGHHDNDRHDDH